MRYADLICISESPEYTEVIVANPWDTIKNLQKYILIPKDCALPDSLPKGIVVRTPVNNALVYSVIHAGLLKELGADNLIGGMCSIEYIKDEKLKKRLQNGSLTDCGQSQNPNIEKIISLHPEIIMLSPYENNNHLSRIDKLGIPIIQCADYMESSPLGRAEWMRFFGMLFGVEQRSEETFKDIEQKYTELKGKANKADTKPIVLTDNVFGNVWNVPCKNSTLGKLIEDAGGKNPFAHYNKSGSTPLSPEMVLATAHDADIWIVRYNQKEDKKLSEIKSESPLYSQFKAFKTGNVYGCNTQNVDLFEETPFHPDKLLKDMLLMIHPELFDTAIQPHYFKKMK